MEADGTLETTGDVVVVKRSTPEHDEQLRVMTDSLSLGPDAVESVLVYVGSDGARTSIRAMTHGGGVSVSFDIVTPDSVLEELNKVLEEHRGNIQHELKIGIARTLVANANY